MDLALARRLSTPSGGRLLRIAEELRALAPHARVERLRRECADPRLVRAVLVQDDLRQRAAAVWPDAARLLFTREAFEQATAWPVAVERAGRWPAHPRGPLVDLGAGIGFDTLAAARAGHDVVAYEADPGRAELLRHNVETFGLGDRVQIRAEDARTARPRGPRAFLDPARRAGGRRTRDPDRFEPPARDWPALLDGFSTSMVKLPPVAREGVDPAGGDCTGPEEVVSLHGRARERRSLRGDWGPLPLRRALVLPTGRAIAGTGRAWPDPVAPREGDWLLDPDPAVTLAGLVGDLARQEGLRPVHSRIAYLIGPGPKDSAPGTTIPIEAIVPPRPPAVEAWCRTEGVGRLTIRTRGVATDARDWHRRLRLDRRAEGSATLVLTRGPDDRWRALLGRDA